LSSSRTRACLRVGCPLRRSSCLAFARARKKSGCIIDAPWGKRRCHDGGCDIGRGDTAPSHVLQKARAFRAPRYPTEVQAALLTNDPQLPLESPPEWLAVVGLVTVGCPPLGGAPLKPRALAAMTETAPTAIRHERSCDRETNCRTSIGHDFSTAEDPREIAHIGGLKGFRRRIWRGQGYPPVDLDVIPSSRKEAALSHQRQSPDQSVQFLRST
jgi:hypothetical protein